MSKQSTNTIVYRVLTRVSSPFAALVHVVHNVCSFLDCSVKWNLEAASKAGFLRLMDRLAATESNNLFRETRFFYNVRTSARIGCTDVLSW